MQNFYICISLRRRQEARRFELTTYGLWSSAAIDNANDTDDLILRIFQNHRLRWGKLRWLQQPKKHRALKSFLGVLDIKLFNLDFNRFLRFVLSHIQATWRIFYFRLSCSIFSFLWVPLGLGVLKEFSRFSVRVTTKMDFNA